MKVPTIKFCNELKAGSPEWESTKSEVFKALEEHGFFEAIYDEIPNDSVEALFESLEKVLPLGTKLKEYSRIPYHRYEGQIPRIPIHEDAFHTADLLLPEGVETFANTFWPQANNPHFCNVVKSYYMPLMKLDEIMKRMVFESLKIENYMDEWLLSNYYSLRFTQTYKSTHEGEVGLHGHTDPGYLTIIKQNQHGLQLLTKYGDWIEPHLSPNSYLIVAGDSLVAWTNDRLESATHRVIRGDMNRCSVQLFSTPKPGYTIKVPKELVDEEHPLRFKPYDITDFFGYLKSPNYTGASLKTYFRV